MNKAKIIDLWEAAELDLSNSTLISGGFDPIHPGHIDYIQAASKLGGPLIVVVNGDNFLTEKKGKPFQNLQTRSEIVASIINVDYVIPFEAFDPKDMSVCVALEYVRPKIFANGGDRKEDNIPEYSICDQLGIKMIFGVGGVDKVHSSSEILKNWRDGLKDLG